MTDHLGHSNHSLLALFQSALERTLPHLSLDLLTNTSSLDAKTVLGTTASDLLRQLVCVWQQRDDVVLDGELDDLGLLAERKRGGLPPLSDGVLERHERVFELQRRFQNGILWD